MAEQFVGFEEDFVSLLSEVNHLAVEFEHLVIDSVYSSCYLSSNCSNCVTISTDISVEKGDLEKGFFGPDTMECHS